MKEEAKHIEEGASDGWECFGLAAAGVLSGLVIIWAGGMLKSLVFQSAGLGVAILFPGQGLGAYLWGKTKNIKIRWALSLTGIVVPLAIYFAMAPWVRAESLPSEAKNGLLWPWIWFTLDAARAAWRLWKSEEWQRRKHGQQTAG